MATFSTSIAVDADDCIELPDFALFDETEGGGTTQLAVGLNGIRINTGLRFTGLTIPQGSTINSATVTLYDQYTESDPPLNETINWYAWDTDNAAQFSSGGNVPSTITKTTASEPFTQGAITPSNIAHDIASILQEIVNRPGWASGNAVNFIIIEEGSDDGGRDLFSGYATPSGTPALLQVDYTAGGGTPIAVFAHHLRTQGIS